MQIEGLGVAAGRCSYDERVVSRWRATGTAGAATTTPGEDHGQERDEAQARAEGHVGACRLAKDESCQGCENPGTEEAVSTRKSK